MTALIIGGGVAGLSAVRWLHRYRAPYRWVSAGGDFGGMLSDVYNPIIDYPGLQSDNGPEAVARMAQWAKDLAPPEHDRIERIRAVDGAFEVTGGDGMERYPFVLVATGTRRRRLGVPGESEALDDSILMSTGKEPERFAGKRVLLVGGGDAAVEGSLNVVDAGADEVLLVTRSPVCAQRHFVEQLESEPRIRPWPTFATPTRFERRDGRHIVHLDDGNEVDVDLAVVRIGVEPVRPKFDPRPRLDEGGFIVVDGRGETDVPGLFAAGDVTSTPLRSIATSVGDGTRAARTIAELLGIWT